MVAELTAAVAGGGGCGGGAAVGQVAVRADVHGVDVG